MQRIAIRLVALAATIVCAAGVTAGSARAMPPATASWPTTTLQGATTNWRLTLLALRKVDRIPNTQWRGYASHTWAFWILRLKMANTGQKAANIADDLALTLKVKASYQAALGYISPGWTAIDRSSKVLAPFVPAAAKAYGGVVPWQVTQPGHSTTYIYVIGARAQESHMNLYNSPPYKPQVFLFDTGM